MDKLLMLNPLVMMSLGIGLSSVVSITMRDRLHGMIPWLLAAVITGLGAKVSTAALSGLSLKQFGGVILCIGIVFGAGWQLKRLFKVDAELGLLLIAGTAICGGSAIAAVSAVTRPRSESIGRALGIVCLLNLMGLSLYPFIGHWVDLSQQQFALWAAVSIHDTSSVIGAAMAYGDQAVPLAIGLKLFRALFILPVTLAISRLAGQRSEKELYPFYLSLIGFAMMAVIGLLLPNATPFLGYVYTLSKVLIGVTFLLIGMTISLRSLKEIPLKELFFAVSLWVVVSIFGFIVSIFFA